MFTDTYRMRLQSSLNGNRGLACDVDNTISVTTPEFFRRLDAIFERVAEDKELSIEEMVEKYYHSMHVPQWNSRHARIVAEAILRRPSFYDALPVIDGAQQSLQRIANSIPLSAYITARPEEIAASTEKYLQSFPKLPVITKPKELLSDTNNAWKAHVLMELYPKVSGIIDDDVRLVEALPKDYQGVVFLFGHERIPKGSPEQTYACRDWDAVEEKACALESVLRSA